MKGNSIIVFKSLVFAAIVGSALFALSSCAKPPTDEMNAAEAAVQRAQNTPEVAQYASSTLARAREALANMQTEAEAKRYDSARNFAMEATNTAEKSISDARAQALRLQGEAEAALAAMRNAVTETDNAIAQGKKATLKIDWNKIDSETAAAKSFAAEAEAAAANLRYRDVVERSATARTALSAITTQISLASLATTRKK
jgi:predicted  nucleic acid-binding Zn-ribbon protein